jgi:RHS repeat-associated protein
VGRRLFRLRDKFGNVTRSVDPNDVVVESTFDLLARPLTSTVKGIAGCDTAADPLCATDLTTRSIYSSTSGQLSVLQKPSGGVTTYQYDNRSRVTATLRGTGTNALVEKIETIYDPSSGRKSLDSYFALESGTWVQRKSDGYGYDLFGWLDTVAHADSTTIRYTHDPMGQVLTVRDENDPAGEPSTHYWYDAAGRLLDVRQKLGAGEIVTAYAYDLHGNVVSVTDPNGNTTTYAYDDFGQLLQQTSPVTGVTRYSYDVGGNLLSTVDANGSATTRSYDVLGRTVSSSSTLGMTTESSSWSYDSGSFERGRLSSLSDPTGTTTYAYERRGLPRSETKVIREKAYVTSFRYDADGNRVGIGYPSGKSVTYTFDYAGRSVSASVGATTLVSSASYYPFGPLKQFTYGNGLVRQTAYGNRYQPIFHSVSGPGGAVVSFQYDIDAVGNITEIHDLLAPQYNRDFGYDDLNRLTAATTGAGLWGNGSYTYDAMGNMLTASLGAQRNSTFTFAGSTPKIATATELGVATIPTYDAAGNETTVGASSYSWSPRNLLSRVETADSVTLNGFDARGIRTTRQGLIKRIADGASLRHSLYTPELQALSTIDYFIHWGEATESSRREIVWFSGVPVAQIDTTPGGGSLRYTISDHLGTPIVQTDASGTVVWRAEHEPYGNVFVMRSGAAPEQPLRFPGQELETVTARGEESYNVFRWYRSGWGRYTQADPIGMVDGPHLYSYVNGRPTMMIDPSGLCAACDDCPSGEWNFDAPGFGVSGAGFYGRSVTWGTYVCKGNGRQVKVRIECTMLGPILGLGIGFSGPAGVKPMACACNETGLLGKSRGWTGWVGPINIDGSGCGTKPGGTSNSFGVSKSWGAGFAGTRCTTIRVE